MSNLELPFGDPRGAELDVFLREIDDALDACFMSEMDVALARAAAAAREAPPPPIALAV